MWWLRQQEQGGGDKSVLCILRIQEQETGRAGTLCEQGWSRVHKLSSDDKETDVPRGEFSVSFQLFKIMFCLSEILVFPLSPVNCPIYLSLFLQIHVVRVRACVPKYVSTN